MYSEFEVDDNLHTWQPIEEPADEVAAPFRVVVAEAAREPAHRESILLEDPDQQFQALVDNLTRLDSHP
jgi:hypothetical protein